MATQQPSYRAVLRTRHVGRAFLPSVLGRLALATAGLAVVLQLKQSTGSFAVAGAVTATLGAANVAAIPWRARLIDRRGQTVVLAALAGGYAASLAALGLAAGAGTSVLLVLAVLAGAATPPFATTMRVLWPAAMPEEGLRTRAFSLDAVAGEITYAVGPLLTGLLAVAVSPLASLYLSVACVLIGAAAFVTSPLSRQQRGTSRTGRARPPSPLRDRGLVAIVVMMVAPGMVLGGVDIAAPALASAAAVPVLSGVLLALFAGASGVSGLVFGRIRVRRPLSEQLFALTVVLLVVTAATGLIGGVIAAVIGFVLSGATLAPALIVGYLTGSARADAAVRTKANSWLDTAVQLGAALGAAVVGALTDVTTPGRALSVCAALAAIAVIVSRSASRLDPHGT